MSTLAQEYAELSSKLYDRHFENGKDLVRKSYVIDDYLEMVRERVLANQPISRGDYQDIQQLQDYQIYMLASTFEMYSEKADIKICYQTTFLENMGLLQNQKLVPINWMAQAEKTTEHWNHRREKYTIFQTQQFAEAAKIDAILEVRTEFISEKDGELIPTILPMFFDKFKQ